MPAKAAPAGAFAIRSQFRNNRNRYDYKNYRWPGE